MNNKKRLTLLLIAGMVFCSTRAIAQTEKDSIGDQVQKESIESDTISMGTQTTVQEKVYDVADKMPEFPGGLSKLMKFISENIQYPYSAEKDKIQGRVIVSFVINSEGYAVDPKVVRGIVSSLDTEAVRIVKKMPRWEPAKKDGKAVAARINLPVVFQLVKRK